MIRVVIQDLIKEALISCRERLPNSVSRKAKNCTRSSWYALTVCAE
jgi:hypothetical protein